jgi:hypothetical protein
MDPTEAEVRRQCINMYLTQKQRNADRRGLGEYVSWSEARYEYDHRRECWPTRSPHPPHELIPPRQKPLRE